MKNCPYCNIGGELYFKIRSRIYYRCEQCDLTYKGGNESYEEVLSNCSENYFAGHTADQRGGSRNKLFGHILQSIERNVPAGTLLDVGTGSGLQAMTAAKKRNVKRVVGLDIDKESIEYCKKKATSKKIQFFVSDLFSIFKKNKRLIKKFDTIIFNPPYLPEDARLKDLTLDGGKKGYEVLERFLNEVNFYLKAGGDILIVFSSLTNKKKVKQIIKKNLLEFRELDKRHIFFEELHVYLIKRKK